MEELCEDLTLKNLVIMIHNRGRFVHTRDPEAQLQSELDPDGFVQAVVRRGAKIYHCTGTSEPDLGALRIILGGVSVTPEVQQEPINKGSKSKQTAVRPVEPSKEKPELRERHNSDIGELGESTQEAVDKQVKELRRELEEQKRRAQLEVDAFKKRIARMQSKEESARKEMAREYHQELEDQKRRAQEEADALKKHASKMHSKQKRKAQEEADGLRKCIAELQSKLEEDRHASGKASAQLVLARSRIFLVGSPTHLALQRVCPSTDLHLNSPVGLTTHFTGRSMHNVWKTSGRTTSFGLSTIWRRCVTVSPFLT